MSLINKALQRTEREKRRHDSMGVYATPEPAPPPPPAEAEVRARSGPSNRTRLFAAVAFAAMVAAGTWAIMHVAKPLAPGNPSAAQAQPTATPIRRTTPQQPVELTQPAPQAPAVRLIQIPTPSAPAPAAPAHVNAQPAAPSPAVGDNSGTLDGGQFKLGAILKSGRESRALINGRMVTIGRQVNGATVVVIEEGHVVLEKGGRRLVLSM